MLLFRRYEYNPQTDLLGKGGFSRVYRGYDKKLNRQVALKIYKTNDIAERYSPVSEIQRVINLDHPNISRYLDIDEMENENAFGEVEKLQVCVMELLDGGTLVNCYNNHKKDPAILIKLLVDVLNGLDYLHQNDIIHRDIKPGNILIKNTRKGPVAKITDFGISKVAEAESNPDSSAALIVSIPYMAPEQLNPKKFGIDGKVSFNIDIWSLGVAVYEIVAGDILFKNNRDESSEQIMFNIISPEIPEKIKYLPEPFRSFVSKCVIKDARQRVSDIDQLIELLLHPGTASMVQDGNGAMHLAPETISIDKTDNENIIRIVPPDSDADRADTTIADEIVAAAEGNNQQLQAGELAGKEIPDEHAGIAAIPTVDQQPGGAEGDQEERIQHELLFEEDRHPDENNTDYTQEFHLKKTVEDADDIAVAQPTAGEENNTDDTQIVHLKKTVENADDMSLEQLTAGEENNTDDTQIVHLKKPVENADDTAVEQLTAGEENNTDDTQIVHLKKPVEDADDIRMARPSAGDEYNSDDTQIIHLKKTVEDADDIRMDQPSAVDENNTDDTQIVHLKKTVEDANDIRMDQPSAVDENNTDDTQIVRLKKTEDEDADDIALNHPVSGEVRLPESITGDTQVGHLKDVVTGNDAGAAANTEDTQVLPLEKASIKDSTKKPVLSAKEIDPESTQVLLPAQPAPAANSDDTHFLQHDPADNDATIFLAPFSSAKKDPEEKPAENKILLFKRYEYYPNKDLIGKGGFSRVYKAFDKKLQRWVALKIYKTGDFSDRYSPIAEIQRVVNLDHPNICRYLDIEEIEKINPFGESENIQVCVMELLDSGNLSEYYKSNPDKAVFKKLLIDVFMGLSYLHKNGIIHRDIKPANILIKQTLDGPIAKITDFGISKKSDAINNNSSSALVVSIPYMAPEQLNVKKYGVNGKISFNLDLWSLGVTIYEVLSGKVLFKNNDGDNSEQIMTNIMAPELPDKIKDLDSPFAEIVSRCIVKKAPDRAQGVEELIAILKGKSIFIPSTNIKEHIPPEKQMPEKKRQRVTTDNSGVAPLQAENETSNNQKSGFYVLEDDVNGKNKKTSGNQRYLIIGGVAVVLITALYFLFSSKQKTDGQDLIPAVVQARETPARPTDTARTNLTPTAEQVINKDSIQKQIDNNAVTPKNNSTVNRNVAKTEKQRTENETRAEKNTVKTEKVGGNKYLLIITPSVDCVVKINTTDNGVIKKGTPFKQWVDPGVYHVTAFSSADNRQIYSKTIDVKEKDLGTIARIRIP